MSQSLLKQAMQSTLGQFGLQLVKTNDSFAMQARLTTMAEPVIFDIGAADGGVAKVYRELFPQAYIHCFEPFPQAFDGLKVQLGDAPRTFCVGQAVSSSVGTAGLNANASSATNSLLPTDARSAEYWGDGILNTTTQVQVPTTTVDHYCSEANVARIDILKIDVQGGEWEVLQGAKGMLQGQRVGLIYTELIVCPTYVGQHPLHEYLAFFDAAGYRLVDFYSPVRRNGHLLQADAIFIPAAAVAA
jgi:FkbM family methyltransferase